MGRNPDDHTAQGFDLIWKRYSVPDAGGIHGEAAEALRPISPSSRSIGSRRRRGSTSAAATDGSVAPRAGFLHCIDQSAAGLASARQAMRHRRNVDFLHASVDAIPLPDGSQDFGYSIGVLHHIPDPVAGLQCCVDKLKPGAPFLL